MSSSTHGANNSWPAHIVVTAAHAGVAGEVPIGGGAAVIHQLLRHWSAAGAPLTVFGLGRRLDIPGLDYRPVPVTLPRGRGPDDLVKLSELAYARVCRDFERATTRAILDLPHRRGLVVLANDLSEGPDFAALAAAGIPVVTLWHVDVVDYFCRFYLRGLAPQTALAAWRAAGSRGLDVLQLVFAKQSAAVAHSVRHVVPSAAMRAVIERCYPGAGRRVEVVPWGAWPTPAGDHEIAAAGRELVERYELRSDQTLLVTLSRLSPEKGIERLLAAIAHGERRGEVPPGLRLWIGGEAAFMAGARYRTALQRQAARLATRVDFLGYVSGARKRALWQLADLYVFPSRHESYGLTLAEALAAGVPVVSTRHYSAADLVPPGAGVLVDNAPEAAVPAALWRALAPLLADPSRRAAMADVARRTAGRLDFGRAATRVADVMRAASAQGAG